MAGDGGDTFRIEGTVASGFESVQALFERNMRTWAERDCQLCVYYRGEKVVDLWGTACGSESFGPDTLVNIFRKTGYPFYACHVDIATHKGRHRNDPVLRVSVP